MGPARQVRMVVVAELAVGQDVRECPAEPPEGVVARLVELFGIPKDWLFRFDDEPMLKKVPVPRVEDDFLKGIPLRKLQRWTGPALQLLGKSAASLARQVELRPWHEYLQQARPPAASSL